LIGAVKARITIASGAIKLRVRMKFLDGAKDASPSYLHRRELENRRATEGLPVRR